MLQNKIIKLQGNDLVTEITANFAFLCFISHYFKNNRFCNPLITFFLPAFASSLKNTCGSTQSVGRVAPPLACNLKFAMSKKHRV